ncbi:HAD family hydrolase [Rhizobium sp. BR 314]|uniref:HAD family hydrolase n=1 Tax=Rhizobium sp. BR 314 TaxID=3040013 RepID=UPI0039BF9D85
MADLTVLDGTTIAFDLDGTLVDTALDIIGAVNAVLIGENLAPLDYAKNRAFVSRGARWLLQSGLVASGVEDPVARTATLFERFTRYYETHIADESLPFPGAVAALKELRAAGTKLVVCTNKPTHLARRLLSELEMVALFDGVVGVDAVSASKPDAAHLVEAVAAVSGDIKRSIMIGDAEPDARSARSADVPLILVSFGYSETPVSVLAPDVLLDQFGDLTDACCELVSGMQPREALG